MEVVSRRDQEIKYVNGLMGETGERDRERPKVLMLVLVLNRSFIPECAIHLLVSDFAVNRLEAFIVYTQYVL